MKTRNTTITLSIAQPRNPLVAAARFRQAGAHRVGRHAQRQHAAQALERELDKLHPPHP